MQVIVTAARENEVAVEQLSSCVQLRKEVSRTMKAGLQSDFCSSRQLPEGSNSTNMPASPRLFMQTMRTINGIGLGEHVKRMTPGRSAARCLQGTHPTSRAWRMELTLAGPLTLQSRA